MMNELESVKLKDEIFCAEMKCDLMLDGIWNVARDSTSCLPQRLKGAKTTAAKSLFYALQFFF